MDSSRVFGGVELSGSGDGDSVLAGVQTSLLEAFADIELWVCRLRDGDGGPLVVDEALTQIEFAVERAEGVCDGQLSLSDGGLS